MAPIGDRRASSRRRAAHCDPFPAPRGAHSALDDDLAPQAVSHAGGTFKRGTRFAVSDTVVNTGRVATATASSIRYYLSLDGIKDTGDTLLTGTRTVPMLAASATSAGSVSAPIPSTVAPGTYVVFACADDTETVAESDETNNCRASATPVVVTQ